MDGAQEVFNFTPQDMAMMAAVFACMAFVFGMNGAIAFHKRGAAALRGARVGVVFAFMLWALLVIAFALTR